MSDVALQHRLRSAASSVTGRIRAHNEDAYAVDPAGRFVLLADGMGGHQAGEVASHLAIEVVGDRLASAADPAAREDLLEAIWAAHQAVSRAATAPDRAGMGCTLAILAVRATTEEQPPGLAAANVGDSRILHLRDGRLRQLSQDHTVAAQARAAGLAMTRSQELLADHTLTQAVGCSEYLAPHLATMTWRVDDRFLLASDGLTDLVTPVDIAAVLGSGRDVASCCEVLVDLALQRGGHDNITVIVCQPADTPEVGP
jgi:PPM family protein phosphatase